jgi:ferritin-like metal-binding protein YciE
MKEIKNLTELFYHEIQAMWSAERLLVDAMPEMINRASNLGLKKSLALHLAETEQHLATMEFLAKQFEIPPDGDFNQGIKGILEEGQMVMSKDATADAMDAALIAGAQKVEHYEISGYGTAACYAEMLGHTAVAQKLRSILKEEQQADTKLNFLAKSLINEKALQAT